MFTEVLMSQMTQFRIFIPWWNINVLELNINIFTIDKFVVTCKRERDRGRVQNTNNTITNEQ